MKLRFLCGMHRVELAQKPEKAVRCWQKGFDTGQFLCDQKMWQEALPHLGCAFETSEILLTTKAVKSNCAYEYFTASALLLISVFAKLGNEGQCQTVYWMAVKRLTRELSCHPEARASIGEHLEHLYGRVKCLDSVEYQANLSEANRHETHNELVH